MARREKPVDGISTHARVAVVKALAGKARATDETEAATRRANLLGLDGAETAGILTEDQAGDIIEATIRAPGFRT